MIHEGGINIVCRCNELLLVSKIYHECKVHWDFFGRIGWLLFAGSGLSWDIKRVVAGSRWLLFAGSN